MTEIKNQNRSLILLLIGTAIVVFPHFFQLPVPVTGFFFILLLWRLAAINNPSILPGKYVLFFMAVVAVTIVMIENRTILGRDAGTSAFLVTLGLKLMELKTQRDYFIIIGLAFFVAITLFLFNQNVSISLYVLAVTWLLVSALISLNAPSLSTKILFKIAGGMLLQAVPIMVFLFVFFPRIPAPQFGLNNQTQQAVSGLSDVLEPGRISRLSLSEATAFRVTFNEKTPPREQRYWRGPVFWYTDGRRWTLSEQKAVPPPPVKFFGPSYRYKIVLEPHRQNWIFALDLPVSRPKNSYLTEDFVLRSNPAVKSRVAYDLRSHPDYIINGLSELDRRRALQLPDGPSRRIRDLLQSWKSGVSGPDDIVRKALDYFRDEPFVYTLDPPLLKQNPVEEFLFESQQGFCEHYATAFVYLMRAAKIPARVVTGYQGGEYNSIGNFIEVRQADAHAWAEAWINEKGWVRVDPTFAVAPERVELGVDIDRQIATGDIAFTIPGSTGIVNWLKQVRRLRSSIDHVWNTWVLDYSAYRQNRLFHRLGLDSPLKKMMLLFGLFSILMSLLTAGLFYKNKIKKDKFTVLYEKFCNKLARRYIFKKPTEGARDFALRAGAKHPDLRRQIDEITQLYLRVRYGKTRLQTDTLTMRKLVRNFRA